MDDGEGMGVMAMQSGSSRSAISASSEMIVEPMLLNTVAAVGRAVASKEWGSRGKRTPMIAFTSSGGVWDTGGERRPRVWDHPVRKSVGSVGQEPYSA